MRYLAKFNNQNFYVLLEQGTNKLFVEQRLNAVCTWRAGELVFTSIKNMKKYGYQIIPIDNPNDVIKEMIREKKV